MGNPARSLAPWSAGRHTHAVPLPPWVIEELEDERRKRDEEERVRSSRIELPQTPMGTSRDDTALPPGALHIVDISPVDTSVIDI